jgi:hypothetical protein
MADISDVEQAVADKISSTLYPVGSTQSSIVGSLCRIYRGWPNSATLNADLSAGLVNVTIVTDNDSGRTTTRYLPEFQTRSSRAGVVANTFRNTITISGNPAVGDVVGALIDRVAYAYRIQTGDTPDLVASCLNQLIRNSRISTVRGSTIIVAEAESIEARVVCDNTTSFESRRQEKDLRVICWCSTPPVRDAVATAIDLAIDQASFLVLPDEAFARVIYKNTASYDQAQNALLYRRDLIYTVEYPTVTVLMQPSMLFGASDINNNITFG